jgi:hypothetical protein
MAAAAAVGLESRATMGSPVPATMGSAVVMMGDPTPPTAVTTPTGDPPGGQWVAGGLTAPPVPQAKGKATPKKPVPSRAPQMGAVDLGE